MDESIPVFDPSKYYWFIMEITVIIFKIILSFFISISFTQDLMLKELMNEYLIMISLSVVYIEMLLKLNLGFYLRGEFEKNRKKIW